MMLRTERSWLSGVCRSWTMSFWRRGPSAWPPAAGLPPARPGGWSGREPAAPLFSSPSSPSSTQPPGPPSASSTSSTTTTITTTTTPTRIPTQTPTQIRTATARGGEGGGPRPRSDCFPSPWRGTSRRPWRISRSSPASACLTFPGSSTQVQGAFPQNSNVWQVRA